MLSMIDWPIRCDQHGSAWNRIEKTLAVQLQRETAIPSTSSKARADGRFRRAALSSAAWVLSSIETSGLDVVDARFCVALYIIYSRSRIASKMQLVVMVHNWPWMDQ